MPSHPKLVAAAALGSLLMIQSSCSTSPSKDATAQVKSPETPRSLAPEDKRRVEDQLRTIAQQYAKYSRVSDERVGWAPESCMGPPPPSVKPTAAPEASPHGRKLYFLYARDEASYIEMSGNHWHPRTTSYVNPVGQAVVKEAFTPVPAEGERARYDELKKAVHRFDHDTPEAREFERFTETDDGKLFRAGDLSTLFVMLKLDPKTPGTDQGWVYATIDKDLKTITSMGAIDSCMNCHKQTDRDRLYGKKRSWPVKWPGAAAPADASTPTTPAAPATPATPPTPR